MTVKLLHHSINKRGGYHDDIDLSFIARMAQPTLWIFDFCAIWMYLLKSEEYACRILQDKLCQRDPKAMQLPYIYLTPRAVIGELVDEILAMVSSLQKKSSSEEVAVCFVLDGQPLHAKRLTHASRSRKSYSSLKSARKLAVLYLAKPEREKLEAKEQFKKKFRACAAGWVRWFQDLKQLVVEEMCARGVANGFQPGQPGALSVVTAAYEADPKCVDLAHRFPQSIIFSNDGDLLVYPYADSSVRVLRVDWKSAKVRFTTKNKVLTALGLLHDDEPDHIKANIRLVVASCIAGTDYCPNYPGKSFGKSREATALALEVPGADVLLEKVLRDMQIPEDRWAGFRITLYQFVMPVVDVFPDGTKVRLHEPSILYKPDLAILTGLDSPLPESSEQLSRSPSRSLRCKNVGCVQRKNLASLALPPPPQTKQHNLYVPRPSKSSSSLKKRTRETKEEGSEKKRRKASEKTADFRKLKKYETVTFQAGLYSSLLAAALARNPKNQKKASDQARFLQSLLRKIAFDLNLVRQIARFMQNLAVRAVFESRRLDKEQKRLFYRNLLYADEPEKRAKFGQNGGRKTQQWFVTTIPSIVDRCRNFVTVFESIFCR